MGPNSPRERMAAAAIELESAMTAADAEAIYQGRYLPANLDHIRESADHADVLILTVGSQPYSVATSLARTPASTVYFVHTARSEPEARRAMTLAGLGDDVEIRWREVGFADSVAVYRVVYEAVQTHRGQRIVIDFTSGTKAMTAGASTSAGYLRVEQIYIASRRLPGPFPYFGDSEVHRVEHPLVVFGDIERAEAERAFDAGRFDVAERVFSELDDARVPGYHFAARATLCRAYRSWRSLRFVDAAAGLERVVTLLERARGLAGEHLMTHRDRLAAQGTAARVLHAATAKGARPAFDQQQWSLLARYLMAAARRERERMADMSGLLWYRTIELAAQRRLAVHGIDAHAARYPTDTDLVGRYNALCRPEHRVDVMPTKLALAPAFTVLALLDDVIVARSGLKLDAFRGKLGARNKSIFAHGYAVIPDKGLEGLIWLLERFVKRVFEEDGIDWPAESDPALDFVRFS